MIRRLTLLSVLACLLAAAPAVCQRLIMTISMPDTFRLPWSFCALAVNTCDSVLYAGGEESHDILVFDEVLNRPVARFDLPSPVTALHYNPLLNRLYCAGTRGHLFVVDCATRSLIADVQGSSRLWSLSWDSLDNKLYIGADSSMLLAFDCSRNEIVGRIRGVSAYGPDELCYVPSTRQVYVTGAGDSLVAVVDCVSDSIATWLRVGSYLSGLTCCASVDRVCLIAAWRRDSLVVIDPASGGISAVRVIPEYCHVVGFNSNTGHLYVSHPSGSGLWVVEPVGESLVRQVSFGDSVGAISTGLYSSRDNVLYVGTEGASAGYCMAGAIDGATDSALAFITAHGYANAVVLGTLTGVFYFVTDDGLLLGFDATRRTRRTFVSPDFAITGLAVSSSRGKVYCTGQKFGDQGLRYGDAGLGWSTVYVVDSAGGRVVATSIEVGDYDSPVAIVVNEDGSKVYFNGWVEGEVRVVEGAADTLLCRIVTDYSIEHLAFGARSNKVYAAGYNSGAVSVIDGVGDSVCAEVPVDGETEDICVAGHGTKVYAFGPGPTVFVIDGMRDSVVAELEVGAGQHRLCWDSRNNRLYVANADSNDVMVFDCETDSFLGLLGTDTPVSSMCFDSTRNRLFFASSGEWNARSLVALDCSTGSRTTLADDVGVVDECPPYYDAVSNLLFYASTTGIAVVDCELDSVVSRVEFDEWLLPFAAAPGWDRVVVAGDWGSRLYVLSSEPRNQASIRPSVPPPVHQQTLVSGSLFVQGAQRAELFSVAGTLVARLVPGYNDVSGVPPGVYFLNRGQGYITRKIVVSR